MKKLTKEQLKDLVFDNMEKVIEQNLESAEKNIKSSIKGSEDNLGETIAKFVISYGTEIKREFCKAIAETLYDILYSE